MATDEVNEAVQETRNLISQLCKKMGPEDYMEFCENISADMHGNIDALKEENPELFG